MTAITSRLPKRSMGLKLLLVCALALLMSIPALFVFALLSDRTNRANQVTEEVSRLIGGPQSFLGPVLSIPYTQPTVTPEGRPGQPVTGAYIVFPETGAGQAEVKTTVRKRGLFKVPVWTADLAFTSSFDLTGVGARLPSGAVLDWSRAEFLVGASDARGAQTNVDLTAGGLTQAMNPALTTAGSNLAVGDNGAPLRNAPDSLRFFGAPAGALAAPGGKFEVSARTRFSGAQRLAVLAFAKTTTFKASGDWNAPSYDGGFLPVKQGAAKGFAAEWSAPFIARGAPGEGVADEVIPRLGPASLGVSFVDTANPYQAVQRSLKYALMFVGLVFLAYFLFETTQKKRVHPAQYVLIGLAQIIFYLLLLSIAERIGFDGGFAIAAAATVGLISAYAGWVFDSRKQGLAALFAFTGLYGLIYVLMRLEDWALLVGAVTSFAAIAAVMYFTRNVDWYGQTGDEAHKAGEVS